MKNAIEIKYNFRKIDEAVYELKTLKNRAIACGNMKYTMQDSEGDSKTALLDAFDAMTDCAASVATMLGSVIDCLNYAKNRMKQEDEALKKKMSDRRV
jgi:hypothetical protein